MALVSCANCGQPVSDRAKVCPHCGYVFPERETENSGVVKCADCGEEYAAALPSCPHCGCPNEQPPIRENKKRRNGLIVVSVIVLLAIIAGMVFTVSRKEQAKQEAEYQAALAAEEARQQAEAEEARKKAEAEEKRIKAELEQYYDNMASACELMGDGAIASEEVCSLVMSVWKNAIWEQRDEISDQFTIVDGKFVDDFNDALDNLYADEGFQAATYAIYLNQLQVIDLMKKLKNPPDKYKEAYEAVYALFESYIDLTGMATSPSGSYNSYSEDCVKTDTEFATLSKKASIYLD